MYNQSISATATGVSQALIANTTFRLGCGKVFLTSDTAETTIQFLSGSTELTGAMNFNAAGGFISDAVPAAHGGYVCYALPVGARAEALNAIIEPAGAVISGFILYEKGA